MRLRSRDTTMDLIISTPSRGFTVSLAGHVWLFSPRLEITGCLPPPPGHSDARSPELCPRCAEFSIGEYGSGKEPI